MTPPAPLLEDVCVIRNKFPVLGPEIEREVRQHVLIIRLHADHSSPAGFRFASTSRMSWIVETRITSCPRTTWINPSRVHRVIPRGTRHLLNRRFSLIPGPSLVPHVRGELFQVPCIVEIDVHALPVPQSPPPCSETRGRWIALLGQLRRFRSDPGRFLVRLTRAGRQLLQLFLGLPRPDLPHGRCLGEPLHLPLKCGDVLPGRWLVRTALIEAHDGLNQVPYPNVLCRVRCPGGRRVYPEPPAPWA